jgi:hypothetical protein
MLAAKKLFPFALSSYFRGLTVLYTIQAKKHESVGRREKHTRRSFTRLATTYIIRAIKTCKMGNSCSSNNILVTKYQWGGRGSVVC